MLSSAHLEKDFTLQVNPMGIIPFNDPNGMSGNENGPRRQEYDGFTYFGVEDGLKNEDDEEDKEDYYIEDDSGQLVSKKLMNDFIIPMNNPNNSGDASKD